MGNFPPDFCPYCGSELTAVAPPTSHQCECCERYVFYNPTPGGSVAVVDGDCLLLVEDFRSPGGWKLPSGAVEAGESLREGAARELEEETNLAVDPAALAFVRDGACEPVDGKHMTNVTFAVDRATTTGPLESGSDATDARFWRPDEFAAAEDSFTDVHVDRFGSDSLEWLLELARGVLDQRGETA